MTPETPEKIAEKVFVKCVDLMNRCDMRHEGDWKRCSKPFAEAIRKDRQDRELEINQLREELDPGEWKGEPADQVIKKQDKHIEVLTKRVLVLEGALRLKEYDQDALDKTSWCSVCGQHEGYGHTASCAYGAALNAKSSEGVKEESNPRRNKAMNEVLDAVRALFNGAGAGGLEEVRLAIKTLDSLPPERGDNL